MIQQKIHTGYHHWAYYYIMIEKNIPKAINYYKTAIEKYDDVFAMRNLGLLYKKSNEREKMLHYFAKIFESNNSLAETKICKQFYFFPKETSFDTLFDCYLEAVGSNSKLLINLANMCFYNKNSAKMIICLKKAIENNSANAMVRLAEYYDTVNNHQETVKYYLMAISHGHVNAMIKLALYCEQNGQYRDMIKYLLLAMQRDNVESMIKLGDYYKNIAKYKMMITYYVMAMKRNSINAVILLASYYEEIENNSIIAAKLHQLVDNPNKYLINATIFYYIEDNFDMAYRYYKKYYNISGRLEAELASLMKRKSKIQMLKNKQFTNIII